MTLDVRTRSRADVRAMDRDELVDGLLTAATQTHGALAARGLAFLGLPPIGFDLDGAGVTLESVDGRLVLRSGVERAGVVGVLDTAALSDLLQDTVTMMGLAMTSRVRLTVGNLNDWIRWEPVVRALLDGRKVHEPGDLVLRDADGGPLDLDRSFGPDDDPETMAHFLHEAGFLHLRGVFDQHEMAALGVDIDTWLARATPDDGESWWATDEHGVDQPVRVLFFHEKSEVLRSLVADERYARIGGLSGDGHVHGGGGEGLVKPLGIVRGLSDLPWHRDCGQGGHSYQCSGLTCGISVTGADRVSGALGVVPGSHRINTTSAGLDPRLDLAPRKLETATGDVTVHCSDTLHRAYPPIERPRKVVYSGFGLPPRTADDAAATGRAHQADPHAIGGRAQRAGLSDVQARIAAADNDTDARRYRPGRGH